MYVCAHIYISNADIQPVADPENLFGGGGQYYVDECHQHPQMEHWAGLLYISQNVLGVAPWVPPPPLDMPLHTVI